MVVFDNLAKILQDILQPPSSASNVEDNSAFVLEQWKLLGQEAKGHLVVGWTEKNSNNSDINTCIGIYHSVTNTLEVLCRLKNTPNIIQASVNSHRTLVSFTVKGPNTENSDSEIYQHCVKTAKSPMELDSTISEFAGVRNTRQIMSAFLEGTSKEVSKLLVLVHLESITLQKLKKDETDKLVVIKVDAITKAFVWAQWDCDIQALYFIHFRKTSVSIEGDETGKVEDSPTLSCFQFHTDLPHETVLNVPLNLPTIHKASNISCQTYEDDPLPLRIHDCSLDLIVVSDGKETICICHHYLYEPSKPPAAVESEAEHTVHFAYSVTLLHHGSVIHTAVPGIPWTLAKTMRPVFAFLGDQYLVIYAAQIFTHLLDVGLAHEPNCHIFLNGTLSAVPTNASRLVALNASFAEPTQRGKDVTYTQLLPVVMIEVNTMDLIEFDVETSDLMGNLAENNCASNRLSILHYFLVHAEDFESVEEAVSILCKNPTDINLPKFFKEVLIGGAYGLTQNYDSTETSTFFNLLPLTFQEVTKSSERKVSQGTCLTRQDILWNTAVMFLSPQQRLKPFITDIWRKLWERLIKPMKNLRFKPQQTVEKPFASWTCPQPESLFPCSSPLKSLRSMPEQETEHAVGDFHEGSEQRRSGFDLPFIETDHVPVKQKDQSISVNLRELSLHLLKNCLEERPAHVHSMAAFYASAQLEMSEFLCHILSKLAGVDVTKTEKGFSLIRGLHSRQKLLLFMFYQRFYNASNTLAYPLPRGFTSFFCYLGFASQPFHHFRMYLENNVFELHMDVMKEIMKDIEDTSEGVTKKLGLLLLLPRSQAKQLLNNWPHGVSLMIRAREHALNLLSGVESSHCQSLSQLRRPLPNTRGLAAFPSANGLSPLDTFLDLLTAKASLADLDFNLLIDATISSTQDLFQQPKDNV